MIVIVLVACMALLWLPFTVMKMVMGEQSYNQILSTTGITHSVGSIGYETEAFTSHIFNLGTSNLRKLLRAWFNIGLVVSMILSLICSLFLICHVFYFAFTKFTGLIELLNGVKHPTGIPPSQPTTPSPTPALVMLIPGVNVPTNDLPFLIVALFVCAVVHEFGHSIAAAVDLIKTDAIGFNLFLMLPSAYVVLPTQELNKASFFARLRIYCAGAWHNVVLCVVAVIAILFFCSPGWSTSLIEDNRAYGHHRGVFVERVSDSSPLKEILTQDRKIPPFITAVGQCQVVDQGTWTNCLTDIMTKNYGYCVPSEEILHAYKSYGNDCCSHMHNRQLCFSISDNQFKTENQLDKICMIARGVTNHPACQGECSAEHQTCVIPDQEDATQHHVREHLLRIKLLESEQTGQDKDIIYYGTIPSLYQQIEVSNFRVKNDLAGTISLGFVAGCEKLLRYVFALSSALAMLNLAPVYMLDGAKIYETLLVFLSVGYHGVVPQTKFKRFYHRLCTFFTILLVVNLVIAVINMLEILWQR